jgi:tRNA dimethylallyltransferase
MPISAWFLVGPTAVGKSAVAQRLAERLQATIVSADAMMVYRGMDIGTAKPTIPERGAVPYWGLDCVTPDQPFSAGDYLRVLRDKVASAKVPPPACIVAGGTGLYISCLRHGLREGPATDPVFRQTLETLHREGGVPALHRELERRAPGRLAELADPKNPRRLIRAIELAHQGVTPRAWPEASPSDPPLVGLHCASEVLASNIARRVHAMYENGLLEEAAALRQKFPHLSDTAVKAIGYAEAWAHLDGRCTRAQAMADTIRRTRQLAKRQGTWFRHQVRVNWVDIQPGQSVDDIADAVEAQWRLDGPSPLQL